MIFSKKHFSKRYNCTKYGRSVCLKALFSRVENNIPCYKASLQLHKINPMYKSSKGSLMSVQQDSRRNYETITNQITKQRTKIIAKH